MDAHRHDAVRSRPALFAFADHAIAAPDLVHADGLGRGAVRAAGRGGWFLRSAMAWERVGAAISLPFAGVHIVEATKQVYRAIPAHRERTRLIPALPPVLVPSSLQRAMINSIVIERVGRGNFSAVPSWHCAIRCPD